MISSVFALKEADTIPEYLVSNEETRLEENYYTNSTLKFLLEAHEELLSYRQDFYKTILESADNPYIINEAFVDIMAKIKQIIKKILAYIESLIKRFTTQLAKFVKSDKHILKRKGELAKFPKDESFIISGYIFTFNDDVPIVDVAELELDEVKDIVSSDDEDKIAKLKEVLTRLSDESKMDSIRGQILNVDYSIPETNFGNEIFSIYRDGKSEESDVVIGKEEVSKALSEFENYNNKIKNLKSLQTNIKSKYKRLESQIDSVINNNKINDTVGSGKYSAEYVSGLNSELNNLLTAQVNQIQRIANLHVQAVAAKLDAFNAAIVQDRGVLYKALSIVQKDINNTRMMRESANSYDYLKESTYRGYVIEKYFMNMNQKHFVEECLALSESNIPELKVIYEDLKMDKKNLFQRLKELIKSIFQKFLMKMNKLILGNKEFLTKYKDIILTKKVEEYKLNDFYDYQLGIKNVKEHKLKKIDIKSLLGKVESDIQKELLPEYKGDGEFKDFCNSFFLSNNTPKREEVSSTSLNMAEIYEFCVGAPAAIKVLQNDEKDFISETDKVMREVLNNLNKSESVSIYGEKYYYSTVLESYINEDGEKDPGASNSGANTNSNDSSNAKADLKLDVPKPDKTGDANKDLDKNVKSDDTGKSAEDQKKEIDKNEDYKKVEDTGKWYLNTLRTISSARITAFQQIYKEYMKILRYHVQKATGSLGTTSKFTEDDVKQIKDAMKEYQNAKDEKSKEGPTDRIISIYKSRNMVIDKYDVQKLVEKNAGNLK